MTEYLEKNDDERDTDLQAVLTRLQRLMTGRTEPPSHPVVAPTREEPTREEKPTPRFAVSSNQSVSLDDLLHLLNLVNAPSQTITPVEKRLALDAFAILLNGVKPEIIETLGKRLQQMRHPPLPLVKAVFAHASAGLRERILEEISLSDHMLRELLPMLSEREQNIIARRHHPGPRSCRWLAEQAPTTVLQSLLRNEEADLDESAWKALLLRATRDMELARAMSRRRDIPAPVAHELFWHVEGAARARLLLRPGSPSAKIDFLFRMLREDIPSQVHDPVSRLAAVWGAVEEGDWNGASGELVKKTAIDRDTARRILRDRGGEALMVLLKATGAFLRDVRQLLPALQERPIARRWPFVHEEERLEDLFARLSFRRARLAMLYWNWRGRDLGPYADFPPLEKN